MRLPRCTTLLALVLSGLFSSTASATVEISHAIALHGQAKYPANFQAFDYVNPKAPKGGDIRYEAMGTFDSLNPFINKGTPAAGAALIYDTLLSKSDDEAFSLYGLLAEKIERDRADNSWITFHLNPKARFSDGQAVTADDVVFTFDIIRKEGDPLYKAYYADIAQVQALDKQRVKFIFKTKNNPELPLIVGQLPILPKHYWKGRIFNETSTQIPLGSGPYVISKLDSGRSISYTLNPNYWGRDLPVNRGQNNFNSLTYIYYRDMTVSFEGFKAGQYDIRTEYKAKTWATEYTFPAARNGQVKKHLIKNENPQGMQAFVFNLRRPLFQDIRVREALGLAFDFEWTNKTIFNNAYQRVDSYFTNSELAAHGRPSPAELAILEPFRKQLPASVFGPAPIPPKTDGSGNNRQNLIKAQKLLADAGWQIKNGQLVNKSGTPFVFELIERQPEMERMINPFRQNLQRLGITLRLRIVDTPQYIERLRSFDFDMATFRRPQSLSPGNEQRNYWGSQAADIKGSENLMGIKSPVVDALIEEIIKSPSREQLIYRTRALDRVLLAGQYMIPQYYLGADRIAAWDFFERPKITPKYASGLNTWWVNPEKMAKIRAVQRQGSK